MAVTGGAAVWSLAAGLRLERLDIGGKAVSRVAEDGQSPSGSGGQICRRPAVSGIKKRTSKDVLFLCVQAEDGTVFREKLQPSQMHVIFGDVPRCSLLWGSGGDQHPDQRKVFSGWGESARGGGTVFTKNVPPPLVQNSVAETIRRRRSRRRHRDWRRFRQGGPDGRLPACAGGCPGGGCIRSRRCAPDGGRR